MKRILLAVAVLATAAYPLVTGYKVEPVKASWSGKVWPSPPQGGVSQIITCNFDSLAYVELFAGFSEGDGQYRVVVSEYGGPEVMRSYDVPAERNHDWLRFDTLDIDGAFTKGKQYEFRFMRTGSDSIESGLDFL